MRQTRIIALIAVTFALGLCGLALADTGTGYSNVFTIDNRGSGSGGGNGGNASNPNLSQVTMSVYGPFLSGVTLNNTFTAQVSNWGTSAGPGTVQFRLNGTTYSVSAGSSGASKTFNMGSALNSGSCATDNTLQVVAFNSSGRASGTVTIDLQCINVAPWMSGLGITPTIAFQSAVYRCSIVTQVRPSTR